MKTVVHEMLREGEFFRRLYSFCYEQDKLSYLYLELSYAKFFPSYPIPRMHEPKIFLD